MALKDLNKINKNLKKRYENKVTTNAKTEAETNNATVQVAKKPYIDRSEDLLKQMNFIAMTNKSLLKLA